MLSVNGLMVDVRSMPREVQEIAFEKGYIPYIPDDKNKNLVPATSLQIHVAIKILLAKSECIQVSGIAEEWF